MTTDVTRREFAKLAGTGALMMSASSAVGIPASAAGSATVAQAPSETHAKAKAATAPSDAVMQRVDELLRQMTVEEKAMQLSSARSPWSSPIPTICCGQAWTSPCNHRCAGSRRQRRGGDLRRAPLYPALHATMSFGGLRASGAGGLKMAR
jgi:hypothetical protein